MANDNKELTKIFNDLIDEYLISDLETSSDKNSGALKSQKLETIDKNKEQKLISDFLATPCSCGKNCQTQFSKNELLESRENYRMLSWSEKNCTILALLKSFQRSSSQAKSARSIRVRTKQKFDYRVNTDRFVCREVFLFYHGETLRRLKSLQRHLVEVGTLPPIHANTGRQPIHACTSEDKQAVKDFVINFASIHGLPDPGRDLRKGKGKLRILLPTVLSYMSIHRVYQKSMVGSSFKVLEYRSFVRIWQEMVPYICFNRPKSDLCMTCENFKKAINQITSDLKENREDEKIKLHQQAVVHLENAKKERDHYNHCIKISENNYLSLSPKQQQRPCKPNSKNIIMHYSWDFAQQLLYPYEDQQVGPIYFKTPRKAQLFGVCCEAIPEQINYLIDEADFYGKGSNTVISLLDHFFENHAFGEKHVCLTADNCVGQNKNNAVLHYLLYRAIIGLHDQINLAFMLVGHTKFGPDGNYGLIRYTYRRSTAYTYDHLVEIIKKSSVKGVNQCQPYRDDDTGAVNFKYKNWSNWLSKYFKDLPSITNYHHFRIDAQKPGVVTVKKSIDSPEEDFSLLKKNIPYSSHFKCSESIENVEPSGLSAERAWYLYDKIREHIPTLKDKDKTCPLPNIERTKTKH